MRDISDELREAPNKRNVVPISKILSYPARAKWDAVRDSGGNILALSRVVIGTIPFRGKYLAVAVEGSEPNHTAKFIEITNPLDATQWDGTWNTISNCTPSWRYSTS